jgi:hypothetical protein
MVTSCGHRDGRGDAGDPHRRRRRGGRAVSDLAESVQTPALDRAIGHDHARVAALERGREPPARQPRGRLSKRPRVRGVRRSWHRANQTGHDPRDDENDLRASAHGSLPSPRRVASGRW